MLNRSRNGCKTRRESREEGCRAKPRITKPSRARGFTHTHTATPTPPPPPKTSLLTARTEPPSPSPAASHSSNRRGEARSAAETKGPGRDPKGGFSGTQAEEERVCAGERGRMDAVGRSVELGIFFFFLSSCSFSTESHQQRLRPRDLQETTPTERERERETGTMTCPSVDALIKCFLFA